VYVALAIQHAIHVHHIAICAQPGRTVYCVSVALAILHAIRVHHIAICAQPDRTVFSHNIPSMARFLKKVFEHKISFYFLYNFVCNISLSEGN